MYKGYRKFFLTGILLSITLVLPIFVSGAAAQTSLQLSVPLPGVTNPIIFRSCAPGQQCSFDQLAQYIAAIYRYGIGLAVALAVMMIMIGGFIWVTAAGATDRVSKAKDFIVAALTGLVLALFSFLILYIVNPRLTQLQTINVSGITAQAPLTPSLPTCTGSATVRCTSPDGYDSYTGVASCDWDGSACVPSSTACQAGFTTQIIQGCAERVLSSGASSPPGTVTGPSKQITGQQFPSPPVYSTKVTGTFGEDRGDHNHAGVDFAANRRASVFTVADGYVYKKGYEPGGWGNYIQVDNGGGVFTLYAHLNEQPSLGVGAFVSAGQTIGRVGTSGENTGPSLHFEVYNDRNGNGKPDTERDASDQLTGNDERVDPLPYLQAIFGR